MNSTLHQMCSTEVLVYLLFVPSMLAMGFMGAILTRDTWIGGLVWSNR